MAALHSLQTFGNLVDFIYWSYLVGVNPDSNSVTGKSYQGNFQIEDFVDHERIVVAGDERRAPATAEARPPEAYCVRLWPQRGRQGGKGHGSVEGN